VDSRLDDPRASARLAPPMVGPWRGSLRARRFLVRRYANPVSCPATPFGIGDRVAEPAQGAPHMHNVASDSELQQSSLDTAMISIDRMRAFAELLAIEEVAAAFVSLSSRP